MVVVAEPTLRPVQALVRWDPAGHAVRELAERAELGFPPVSRMASVTGTAAAVADLLRTVRLPDGADVLGPVPLAVVPSGRPRRTGDPPPGEHWDRVLLRVRPGSGGELAAALKAAQIARLARQAVRSGAGADRSAGHRLTGAPARSRWPARRDGPRG